MKKVLLAVLVFGQMLYGQNQKDKDSVAAKQLDNVVITANRGASLKREVPVAISKVTQKTINETKATAVYEIVNKVPGVLMVNLGNEQHSMAIRQPMTTNPYYLYLEDGLSIRPMGVFNHNALLEINQFNLQNIEVVRGPVSSLYGPEAVGGAVNLISLKPSLLPEMKVGLQADQWGYMRFQAAAGATVGKVGIYVAGLTSAQRDSWKTYSDYNKDNINARMDYNFNKSTRLIWTLFSGRYYSDMSSSVNETDFYNRTYKSTTDFTYRKSDALRSRLTFEKEWNPKAQSSLTAFTRDNELGQNPAYVIRPPATGQTTTKGEINSNNFKSYGMLGQHNQKFDFLDGSLVVGGLYDNSPVDYNAYQVDLKANFNPDGTVSTYEIIAERPDLKKADYNARIYNTAGFAQLTFRPVHNLIVTGGARYDKMSFDYTNNIDQSTGNKVYDQFTFKGGINYNPFTCAGFYGNYSQGFAPPGLTSIFKTKPGTGAGTPNPAEFYYDLEPAEFDNYEVGGWIGCLEKKMNIEYSVYYMQGKNELLNVLLPGSGNVTDLRSVGETLHKGVELSVNYFPNSQFKIRAGGTYAKHEFVDFKLSDRPTDPVQNLDGKEMPSAPHWVANSEVTYYPKWLPNLRAGVEWQLVSSWYMDQVNTVKYDGYNVFNGRIGYQYKGFEFYTNVMNFTDKLYAYNATRDNTPTSIPSYTPAAPRTFVFGLQYYVQLKKKKTNEK